jgi:uncharacterized membrane protein
MATLPDKIDELTSRINELAAQQTHLGKQLLALMNELSELKRQAANSSTAIPTTIKEKVPEKVIEFKETITAPVPAGRRTETGAVNNQRVAKPAARTASFEEFVGKNLASKIGILVTIVGIFIGARYAIEHQLVSPLVRVISGYVWGLVFMGVALKLKKKYEGYSSVLMGGGLCVLYFMTYIAWSFYNMLPQLAAFGLMLLFTATIVYMAIWYNRIIIAHLGQVAAYAIPFLLSDDSGRYAMLFTYIAIVNAGILVLSFYKYWKSLFHVAFALTWLIYIAWFAFQYNDGLHFGMGVGFLLLFFIMFYATFLSYKLVKKEQFGLGDIYLLLSNAFVFYAIGYAMLEQHPSWDNMKGAFTVVNALIHLGVSLLIRKLKLADRALYYLVLGLVIVFAAIAVPVQFDGNWVTLLWTAEAVLLFVIGRTRQVAAYEKLAAPLTLLAAGSQAQDWINYNAGYNGPYFFFNITFITALLVAGALGTITWFNYHKKWRITQKEKTLYQLFFDFVVPALLLLACYFLFYVDINQYFMDKEPVLEKMKPDAGFLELRHTVTNVQFLYTEVFIIALLIVYRRWIRSEWLVFPALLGIFFLSIFLVIEILPSSNNLLADYFAHRDTGYFGPWNIVLRYLILGGMAGVYLMGSREISTSMREPTIRKFWWLWMYLVLLVTISYEYLNWAAVSGSDKQYKVGLSIIWGLYALALVIYGIWKKLKYIRLAAIVLFIATIIKLFVYDLAGAGTITKTVSFISLGVILLLVSYLYNRYKEALFGED